MSEYTQLALTWLRGIDPALPVALLIVTVLLTIYSIRRWKPTWWLWVESTVPLVDSIDPGPGLDALWAAWQAWPAVALGTVLSALAAGANVRHALWGALAGAISAVVHVIMSKYKGLVGPVPPPAGPSTMTGRRISFPSDPKPPTFPPAAAIVGLLACLTLGGCGLFAAAVPYLAEAAVVISDAVNAVDAAEALVPSLHLTPSEQAKVEADIARARKFLAAAARADQGAQHLTAEELDASLADFRGAWKELQEDFAAKRGVALGAEGLPVPLAVVRVRK